MPRIVITDDKLLVIHDGKSWEIDALKLLQIVARTPQANQEQPPLVVILNGESGQARLVLFDINGLIQGDKAKIYSGRANLILPANPL